MKKNIIKSKEEIIKICKLCKAKFEVWSSTMDLNQEEEEKMSKHFLHYCPVCKCPSVFNI